MRTTDREGAASIQSGLPDGNSYAERTLKARRKIPYTYHVNGRSQSFLIFPPLAAICAALVYPYVETVPIAAWCAGYLCYLLVRSVSQRVDIAQGEGLVSWGHAKASAATNAAFFGMLIPLFFGRLPLVIQLQLTAVLLLAVVFLVAARYNAPTITRLYQGFILAPVAFAWIWMVPAHWGVGAFLISVIAASEFFVLRMRRYWIERALLESDNEELAEQLSRRVMQLELVNKSRTEQLITACHDLRQPAHAMSLSLEAVLIEAPAGEMKEHIKGLQRSNSVLNEMLASLMDLARLDSGAMRAHSADVSLHELLEDARQQFSTVARHKGVFLNVLDSFLVVASDLYLLRRIVFNLASNAIRYTKKGGVTISVEQRGQQVLLKVQDTGIGIPLEHHARVFEEYTRLDPSGEGMGIGLSVVRRACDLLNHELLMESDSAGTKFTIVCRLSENMQNAPLTPSHGSAHNIQSASNNNFLIAVLEDDVESLKASIRLLLLWGYVVVGAESFEVLSQKLKHLGRDPDVLITDLHLGDEDGISAALNLRAWKGLQDLPVLLITGDLEAQNIARAGDLGFSLMHKPVRVTVLMEALDLATTRPRAIDLRHSHP